MPVCDFGTLDNHSVITEVKKGTLFITFPFNLGYNFVLIDLPDHAFNIGLEVSGVHNRTIIKDNDFYIETSYNFFTLDVERKEKISAETATIFKRDVEDYFNKQKQLYHIMR